MEICFKSLRAQNTINEKDVLYHHYNTEYHCKFMVNSKDNIIHLVRNFMQKPTLLQ